MSASRKNMEEMEQLASKAMKALGRFFDQPSRAMTPDERSTARIASSVLSTWATLQQAENSAELVRLAIQRENREGKLNGSRPRQIARSR